MIHRLPRLSWINWVRLALIPAGGDWRDLPKAAPDSDPTGPDQRLAAPLTDKGSASFHNQLQVTGWEAPAPTITGAPRPGNGAVSVCDPRLVLPENGGRHEAKYRVTPFGEPAHTVTSARPVTSGGPAVADPRARWALCRRVARAHRQRGPGGRRQGHRAFRFGLYRSSALVGVAVFSHPSNDAVLTTVFPGAATESLELGRFVLLDDVPGNGETWFLGRCFDLLRREQLVGVVSFSDPVLRQSEDGDVVFPGHLGTIYQAHNAVYLGRSSPSTLRLLPDGTVFSNRAAGKVRRLERGWSYASGQLVKHGADPLDPGREDSRVWLHRWTQLLTRPLRHHGNHKYAWALARRVRRFLPQSLAYPKQLERSAA